MWRDLGEMARVRTNVQIALAPFPEVHHKIFHLAMGCFGGNNGLSSVLAPHQPPPWSLTLSMVLIFCYQSDLLRIKLTECLA